MNTTGKLTPAEIVDLGRRKAIFPLQTKQSLARRWGVSVQVVNNWAAREQGFPQPVEGIIETSGTDRKGGAGGPVYALCEVEAFEQARQSIWDGMTGKPGRPRHKE